MRRQGILRVSERDQYGATATFREDVSGETWTRSVTGVTAVVALREMVGEADSWPGSWKLVAFSTPQTIFTDMAGTRFAVRRTDRSAMWSVEPYQVERLYLQRIGRLDLLPVVSGVPMVDAASR